MSQTESPDDQHDATQGGHKPGDSIRELNHPGENVGVTEEETARRQANVDAAAQEAERIRNEPGHQGRDHL